MPTTIPVPTLDLPSAQRCDDQTSLIDFLDRLESQLEELGAAYSEAVYRSLLGEEIDLEPFDAARREIALHPEYLPVLQEWSARIREGELGRRLLMLERHFLLEQVAAQPEVTRRHNELRQQHAAFRPQVGSERLTNAQLRTLLKEEPNRARREVAFLARGELAAETAPVLRALVELRNLHAQRLGAPNYFDFALSLSDMPPPRLFDLLDRVLQATEPIAHETMDALRHALGVEDVRAWDVRYGLEQTTNPPDRYFPKERANDTLTALLRGWGIEPDDLPIQLREADIPYGGVCFGIRVPSDIRVLCNPIAGREFWAVLHHEYGHALHAAHIRADLPFSLRNGETGFFAEAMAVILGHIVAEPEWQREFTEMPEQEIRQYRALRRRATVDGLRHLTALIRFEEAMYANPSGDLDSRYRRILEAVTLVRRDESVPMWAADTLFATHPVYFQNYFLAELIRAQTYAYWGRAFGRVVGEPRVAGFLIDTYYATGAAIPWPTKVQQTGASLRTDPLLQELAS